MKTFITALLIMVFMVSVGYAADINAPGGKPITLQSEIRRGNDAAVDAFLPSKTTLILLGNIRVFQDVMTTNEQNNTDSDGFKLGAYYRAWECLSISINVALNYPKFFKSADIEYMKDRAAFYYDSFRSMQSKLGLSDDDFFNALGYQESYREHFIKEISTGIVQPLK